MRNRGVRPRLRTVALLLIAVLLSPAVTTGPYGAGSDPCERNLGDICLHAPAADLLADVEQLYDRPVELGETTKAAVGSSGVHGDGTPFVELNPIMYDREPERQEAAIVHELFHLKMKAEGYPLIRIDPEAVSPEEYQFLLETVRLVFDPIEHRLFDPKIRAMGLDPDAEIEEHFRAAEPRPDARGYTNYYQRAITMMRVVLECSPQTALRIERSYKFHGWDSALNTGRDMAALVAAVKQYSPDDELVIYIKCLNRLLGDRADIRRLGWEDERHGQVVYRVALLRVTHRTYRD